MAFSHAGVTSGDGVWVSEMNKIKEKLKLNCSLSTKKNDQAASRVGPLRSRSVVKLPRTYPYSIPQRQDRVSQHIEIATHTSEVQLYGGGNAENVSERQTIRRPCRTPSLPSNSSEFVYQSKNVNRHSIATARNHSPKRTRTRSRSPNNRLPLTNLRRSPTRGSGDLLHIEAVKSRIRKLPNVKLYLLRQPGPHSFTVAAGESAEQTFKVSIGPQTCTCGPTSNCIHLLFIMLRVFRVSETEPCLFSKNLKNYEVESLFRNYHQRIQSRLEPPCHLGQSASPDSTTENENDENIGAVANDVEMVRSRPQSPVIIHESKDDVDQCAICRETMLKDESLVVCNSGCKNKLHQQCMDIWSSHNETVRCPLCRCVWLSSTNIKSSPPQFTNEPRSNVTTRSPTVHACQNDLVSSSSTTQPSVRQQPIFLNFEDVPVLSSSSSSQRSVTPSLKSLSFSEMGEGQRTCAKSPILVAKSVREQCKKQSFRMTEVRKEWKEAFGSGVANDVQAGAWAIRDTALRKVIDHAEEVMNQLGTDDNIFGLNKLPEWLDLTKAFADVLSVLANDPVFKVYNTSLEGLSSLLGFYVCVTEEDADQLRELVFPIIRTILTKCADVVCRTALLSMNVIKCLCCGQSGKMAIGRHTNAPVREDVCGINFVLDCIMKSDHDYNGNSCPSWQRDLGPLYALDELMDNFPEEFRLLQKSNLYKSKQTILIHLERIKSILDFSITFLKDSHLTVRKMALRIYIRAARSTQHVPQIYAMARQRLLKVDESFADRLRDQMPSRDSLLSVLPSKSVPTDKRVLYTAVQVPDRRRSLGRSVPVSPSAYSSRGRDFPRCSTPIGSPISTRHSLPVFHRSMSASTTTCIRSSLQFSRKISISSTTDMDVGDDCVSSKFVRPRRPDFLPLNRRMSLDDQRSIFTARSVPRRKSCGNPPNSQLEGTCNGSGDGTPCCFNRVCHVHTLPCEGNCHDHDRRRSSRHRPPPSVPPNTPQCPVGDLIDLSAPAVAPPMQQHPSFVHGVAMSLLDAIPEANSANLLALKCQRYPDLTSTQSPMSPSKYGFDMGYDPLPNNSSSLLPGAAFAEKILNRLSLNGTRNKIGLTVDGNNSFCTIGNTYTEGTHWTRCGNLGKGGYSVCCLGRDVRTGAMMAVKQVPFNCCDVEEKEKRRGVIHDEIKMMMKLDHPNIVRLLGASQQKDHYDMFVEWMPGGSVSGLLDKFGPFTEDLIALYTAQVLSGLDYLHNNCILHRDLKGANLLIDSTGQKLHIADFGTAKRMATKHTLPDEFRGDVHGTIAFMAPEVLRGDSYGRKCDVWSVGCCVFEMVSTKPPWNAESYTNENALIYKIARAVAPPPMPENITQLVEDFALRCLQMDSEQRLSVKELQDHHLFTLLEN